MMDRSFAPAWGSTTAVTNTGSATAAIDLPKSCEQVMITNTSSTAYVMVMVTQYLSESSVPTGDAPTLTSGVPIMPGAQSVLTVGLNCKVIRTISSAADGVTIINPGNGL